MDDNLKGPLIRFRYDCPAGLRPAYVNGVYGGVTPYREILANFYLERPETPAAEVRMLNRDGTLGPELPSGGPGAPGMPGMPGTEAAADDGAAAGPEAAAWVRSIHAGIILSLDNAKSIHAWLGEQIRTLESLGGRQESRDGMKQ